MLLAQGDVPLRLMADLIEIAGQFQIGHVAAGA
jgi:hypothetical protein